MGIILEGKDMVEVICLLFFKDIFLFFEYKLLCNNYIWIIVVYYMMYRVRRVELIFSILLI